MVRGTDHWEPSGFEYPDGEYRDDRWERAVEHGFPEYAADMADERDVPPPEDWQTVTPWIDTSVDGLYGFEVETADAIHWVWIGDREDWAAMWDWIEDYTDAEFGDMEYE